MRGDNITPEQAKDLLGFNSKMGNCMPSWMKEELEKKARETQHISSVKDLTDRWMAEAKRCLEKAAFYKDLNNDKYEMFSQVAETFIKCAEQLRYLKETKAL